jgi:ribonuclease BN (tRNA processing enzyme)
MELTVLGASGSYPTASSACSGYLLRAEGYTVWMDAGNGTLGELQKHIGLREVDAIVLSHAHPDHCADLYPFFFALLFPEPDEPIPVFAPPGVRDRLAALIGDDTRDRWNTYLGWMALSPGDVDEAGPFRLEAFEAAHSIDNNTLRIEHDDRTLCYSGDTGPNPHLAVAARDADLFLCEASWSNEQSGIMGPVHLTAGQAGEAAAEAGARRLMVTHMWADNDHSVMREQAAATYGGPVELAVETTTTSV